MEPDRDLPTRRRDELREACAGGVVVIIALTLYGLLAPTRYEILTLDTLFDRPPIGLGDFLAFSGLMIGSLVAGAFGWALLVEHRRPWPLGGRLRLEWRGYQWASVFAILVGMTVPRLISESWQTPSGLYGLGDAGNRFLDVEAPVDPARLGVVFMATYVGAFAVGRAIGTVRRRRATMTSNSSGGSNSPASEASFN